VTADPKRVKGILLLQHACAGTRIECNVIHIPRSRLVIQYLIQQTAQSVTSYHLSLMSPLYVSTSITPSSGSCVQRHTSTENSARV
jgi:hypothetical protein